MNKVSKTTRLVEKGVERSEKLTLLARRDEMPYGYSDKPPKSVQVMGYVLGGQRGEHNVY